MENSVANANNSGNDFAKGLAAGVRPLHEVVYHFAHRLANLVQNTLKEIHDRLQRLHGLVDRLQNGVIVFQSGRDFHQHRGNQTNSRQEWLLADQSDSLANFSELLLGAAKRRRHALQDIRQTGQGAGIVADIPLIVALQGVHFFEFVVHSVHLVRQLLKSRLAALRGDIDIPQLCLQVRHTVDE